MTRRAFAVDVTGTVLVLGLSLAMLASRGLGEPDPATRGLDLLGVLLVVASALPLLGSRLAPLPVYATTSVVSLLLLYLDYGLNVPLAPMLAVYTVAVAYSGDPRPAWRRGAMLAAAGFIPAALVVLAVRGVMMVPDHVAGLLFWLLMIGGAWLAGDRTRLRQERVAELEERAGRAEREAERERRLAAAEERTRIARELHDSAGHAINVILVQAGAARLLHDSDPEESRRAITTIEEVARGTIAEIDDLVRALRADDDPKPAPADPSALEELFAQHRAGGLRIAASVDGPRRTLPRSVAWAAYRILQEALTNAARYGRGSADVAVQFRPEVVEITVTNPALPDGSVRNGGHGVIGMRERATLLGGTLEAAYDHGTFRLYARLPHAEVAQ